MKNVFFGGDLMDTLDEIFFFCLDFMKKKIEVDSTDRLDEIFLWWSS
jgi:hypothetical protein